MQDQIKSDCPAGKLNSRPPARFSSARRDLLYSTIAGPYRTSVGAPLTDLIFRVLVTVAANRLSCDAGPKAAVPDEDWCEYRRCGLARSNPDGRHFEGASGACNHSRALSVEPRWWDLACMLYGLSAEFESLG